MRILLISPLPPPAGGIASWTKRYLSSKRAQENEVDVVNIAVMGERVRKIMAKKNLVEEIKRLFCCLSQLKNKLRHKSYDIVHLNSSCNSLGLIRDLMMARIVKKRKTKLLVHFRCDVTYMLKTEKTIKRFKKLVELADCILTLNKVSYTYILEQCDKESIILPNYISDEYVLELDKKKIIKESVDKILFVGHVTVAKGCDLIYKLAEEFPQKEFILIGAVSEQIAQMKKPENVFLRGELHLEEIKSEYMNADVFLLPTHTEGFPNVVTEAMACGLPIIATEVGAIPDMIEGKGGILVPISDEEALIKAINIINDKELRTRMSYFNQDKVQNEYTIDRVMKVLFEIYERIN